MSTSEATYNAAEQHVSTSEATYNYMPYSITTANSQDVEMTINQWIDLKWLQEPVQIIRLNELFLHSVLKPWSPALSPAVANTEGERECFYFCSALVKG